MGELRLVNEYCKLFYDPYSNTHSLQGSFTFMMVTSQSFHLHIVPIVRLVAKTN